MCQNYKYESGCKYGNRCYFRHVEGLEIPIRENLFGIKSRRQILQGYVAPNKNAGERVHREASFKSVNLMSVVLAHPGLRRGHKTKPRTKKDAPADLAKNVYTLKNTDNVNTTPRRIWTSKTQNTSQQTSIAKSESTVLKIQ